MVVHMLVNEKNPLEGSISKWMNGLIFEGEYVCVSSVSYKSHTNEKISVEQHIIKNSIYLMS